MALINTDWSRELGQLKGASREIVEEQLAPMLHEAITQAGDRLSDVVKEASEQVQTNIHRLSDEIHSQRRLTSDELRELIDYACLRMGATVDERLARARVEASALVAEKIAELRNEFEEAAVRSRRTLYLNIALSAAAAFAMAIVGFVYKKVSIGELDVFSVFRVLLLSSAVGTGLFSLLKLLASWRSLSGTKKNVATTVLNLVGVFRPNGALGLLLLCLALLVGWYFLSFHY